MKKLILAGASLAAMTMSSQAMAQAVAFDALGNPIVGPSCPVGANNCSVVDQTGDNNTASVSQPGDGNASDLTQTGTFAGAGNSGTVTQDGDGNFSVVVQDTSTLNINPVFASVTQSGISSLAEIDQITNVSGDSATINQAALSDTSFAAIEQTGAVGGAVTGSTATINQNAGFVNDAAIVQGRTSTFDGSPFSPAGVVTDVDGASATITQTGDFNSGSIIQGGTTQNASITQDSSAAMPIFGNFALVIQGSGDVSSLNTATVSQTGDDNTSEVYQNDNSTGSMNSANVTQTNDGNLSRITQNGSMHSATVNQADGSTSIVNQNGTGNSIVVNQGI